MKRSRTELGDRIVLACDCCRRRMRRLHPFLKHQTRCRVRVAASAIVFLTAGRAEWWIHDAVETGTF